MRVEFKKEKFIGIKNTGPIQSEKYVTGLPYRGTYFADQMQLIGEDGIAVVTLMQKDAYGQKVTQVRKATPEEMVEFSLGIADFIIAMDSQSGNFTQATMIARNQLARMAEAIKKIQPENSFAAEVIQSRRRSLP